MGAFPSLRAGSSRVSMLALAVVLTTGLAPLPGFVKPILGAASAEARGPESLADLAEEVSGAVVNISATQTVEDKRPGGTSPLPNMPPGTPFDELFEEFFKRRQQQGGNNDAPRPQRKSNSLGSGFVIDSAGIVITNNHVIAGATEVSVIFTDGQKLKAEVIGKDAKVDIAVLRVKPEKPLKAVKFGDSEKMRVGDWVMAVGNPFGLGGTVTAGIVSARNRNIDSGPYDNYIQTDASINKGNSGGPLFNMAGEVIGVNTAILSPSGGSIGIGFASPSSSILPVIDQLRQFGETRRGWLGVRIQNVDDAIAESLNLGKVRGALIAGIDERGPAKPAGLKAGDVIVKFDGKDVKESRDLPKLVAAAPVGKDVDVIIVRDGKEEKKSVKLGRLEDGEKQASLDKNKDADKPAAANPVQKALGMDLMTLDDEARAKFKVKDTVKNGVLVTNVNPTSGAAEKRIQTGDVIVEINQEMMNSPADIVKKMKALKDGGKKSALLLVANAQGEVRFVALVVE